MLQYTSKLRVSIWYMTTSFSNTAKRNSSPTQGTKSIMIVKLKIKMKLSLQSTQVPLPPSINQLNRHLLRVYLRSFTSAQIMTIILTWEGDPFQLIYWRIDFTAIELVTFSDIKVLVSLDARWVKSWCSWPSDVKICTFFLSSLHYFFSHSS